MGLEGGPPPSSLNLEGAAFGALWESTFEGVLLGHGHHSSLVRGPCCVAKQLWWVSHKSRVERPGTQWALRLAAAVLIAGELSPKGTGGAWRTFVRS